MKELILASGSKYRKQQLESIGLKFGVQSANVDEDFYKEQISDVKKLTEKLAEVKALDVLESNKEAVVIGGDQMLSFDQKAIGKSGSIESSIEQIKAMSGKTAQLITSICIASKDKKDTFTVIAHLQFKELSEEQITTYVNYAKPIDCAGSFKLEVGGVALFDKIECEDHSSIIGIPLMKLSDKLMAMGIPCWQL